MWPALAVTAAAIAAASVLFNRLLIAPLVRRGAGFVGVVIVTVPADILEYCIVAIVGPDTVSYPVSSPAAPSAVRTWCSPPPS